MEKNTDDNLKKFGDENREADGANQRETERSCTCFLNVYTSDIFYTLG